jgi:predicted nucleic acid-binding protein
LSLYVDSSVWFAAADTRDRSNPRARKVLASGGPLVTSDHVVAETWGLLHKRLNRSVANRFWDSIRGGVATVQIVSAADIEAAWAIRGAFEDQDFSFVDLTSFAIMQRLGLHRVAAFDRDFAIFRFGPRKDKAFTVLP